MIINISRLHSGKVLREYLRREIGFSSKQLKRMKFSEDGIKVNGSHVTVRYILNEGDVLELADTDTEDDVNPYIVPGECSVEVLLEDSSLTVINKPPMMPAHPSLGHKTDTAANALASRYIGTNYVFRPVNRLDRDTSGVMITANSRLAAYKMFREMKAGRIRKTYVAVLEGELSPPAGKIESYIKRAPDSIMEREECHSEEEDSKYALTEYSVISSNGRYSVVRAEPITGRTHQLRVHFAGRGCPIVGDTLYGNGSEYIDRQALHAIKSEFDHPESGENIKVSAPLAPDMTELIKKLFSDSEEILRRIGEI